MTGSPNHLNLQVWLIRMRFRRLNISVFTTSWWNSTPKSLQAEWKVKLDSRSNLPMIFNLAKSKFNWKINNYDLLSLKSSFCSSLMYIIWAQFISSVTYCTHTSNAHRMYHSLTFIVGTYFFFFIEINIHSRF